MHPDGPGARQGLGDGPGKLTQWTDRALMTDKAPSEAAGGGADGDAPARRPSGRPADRARAAPPGPDVRRPRPSSRIARPTDRREPGSPRRQPKPKTRAGRPIGDKDLLTITWTERMEFTGRTTDTSGRPAGRADFFGIVNAKMTDCQLHCDRR